MNSCTAIRELFSAVHEGEADADTRSQVACHLETCQDCGELYATMRWISDTVQPLQNMVPPPDIAAHAGSPCRRWLGLLFLAVDRELSEKSLNRLLSHLESCEGCRRAWNDMTLIHQVGDAMVPPPDLVGSCIAGRLRPLRRRFIGGRAAIAAAYAVAIAASLLIPKTVTQARETVGRVSDSVSVEVAEVAREGRGEARVIMWRAWQWSSRKARAVAGVLGGILEDEPESNNEAAETGRSDNDPTQGGPS